MPTSDTLPIASLAETRPRSPEVHLLHTESGDHAFVVDGSRLFDLDKAAFAQLSAALDSEAIGSVLDELGLAAPSPYIDDVALTRMPVRALSLAIAQKCRRAISAPRRKTCRSKQRSPRSICC